MRLQEHSQQVVLRFGWIFTLIYKGLCELIVQNKSYLLFNGRFDKHSVKKFGLKSGHVPNYCSLQQEIQEAQSVRLKDALTQGNYLGNF